MEGRHTELASSRDVGDTYMRAWGQKQVIKLTTNNPLSANQAVHHKTPGIQITSLQGTGMVHIQTQDISC